MKRWGRHARQAAVVAAALLAWGCGGADEGAAAPPVEVDTTNADQLDGLSAEQIESAAQAMSPEEAAARGIVDTTIHLENLGSQDTVRLDTAAGSANTARDSVKGSP